MDRERDETKEASNVSIALKGGGGYGASPDQMMTSVHVAIQYHSKYDAATISGAFLSQSLLAPVDLMRPRLEMEKSPPSHVS